MMDGAWQVTVTSPTITSINMAKKYSLALRCPTRPWASKSQAHVKVWKKVMRLSCWQTQTLNARPRLARILGCVVAVAYSTGNPMGRFNLSNRYWQSCSNTKPISSLNTGFPHWLLTVWATAPRHVWACAMSRKKAQHWSVFVSAPAIFWQI